MSKGLKRFLIIATMVLSIVVALYALMPMWSAPSDNRYVSNDTIIALPPTISVLLPDAANFAGERVPLEYFDVRESLDRELTACTYWHTQTLLIIKKADRFFSIIEPILARNGVPDDFKYLAITESNLMPTALSPSKAAGIWQILEETGKQLGLEVNKEVDERYHLEKSTEAACKYLKQIYERTGSWTTAAASYNCGPTAFKRQVERQVESNYYDMQLPEETARYVFRTLAFKIIISNPQQYGFMVRPDDIYPQLKFKEVQVDTSITNVAQFAQSLGTNYKMVKMFNPWLRDTSLPNASRKKYVIKIPINREL